MQGYELAQLSSPLPAVVLSQDGQHPLHGAQHRPVDHHWPLGRAAIFAVGEKDHGKRSTGTEGTER